MYKRKTRQKNSRYIVKKVNFAVPSRDVTNQTLPGPRREKLNYSRPGIVWLLISRLGTGKLQLFLQCTLLASRINYDTIEGPPMPPSKWVQTLSLSISVNLDRYRKTLLEANISDQRLLHDL
jgi:hypothetical protein